MTQSTAPAGRRALVLRSPAFARRYRSARRAGDRLRVLHLAEQPLPVDPESLADPAADHGGRGHRDRPDADRADRRHRSVVRHGDGVRLDHHDQVRGHARRAARRSPIVCGIGASALFGAAQRRADHAHQAARVHRHAGHAEHRVRAHADLLERGERLEPAGRDDVLRQHLPARRRGGHVRHGADAADVSGRRGSCCAIPCPAGISTRSATTPKPRA